MCYANRPINFCLVSLFPENFFHCSFLKLSPGCLEVFPILLKLTWSWRSILMAGPPSKVFLLSWLSIVHACLLDLACYLRTQNGKRSRHPLALLNVWFSEIFPVLTAHKGLPMPASALPGSGPDTKSRRFLLRLETFLPNSLSSFHVCPNTQILLLPTSSIEVRNVHRNKCRVFSSCDFFYSKLIIYYPIL